MRINATAWVEGPNIKMTFQRDGHPVSVYVIDPDARIISVENPLPAIIDPEPDFRKAIASLLTDRPPFETMGFE